MTGWNGDQGIERSSTFTCWVDADIQDETADKSKKAAKPKAAKSKAAPESKPAVENQAADDDGKICPSSGRKKKRQRPYLLPRPTVK